MSSVDGIVPPQSPSVRRGGKDKPVILVAKPYSPPPLPAPLPRRRKKKLLLLLALALFVALAGGLTLFKLASKSRGKEAEEALAMLKDKQRDWWENQGLGQQPPKDADAAWQDLQKKQRGWWETQQLAKDNDPDGSAALQHLEEMQRGWWEKEGLGKGETPKDPARSLGRLDDINRRWWDREQPGKTKGDQEAGKDDDDGSNLNPDDAVAAVEGGPLADLKVKLANKKGTEEFLKAGGTEDSEKAVQLGLQWLAAQQQNDGRWNAQGGRTLNGRRGGNDIASTAFALLPFLARGETHKGSQETHMYTKVVENGIRFLIAQQKPNGEIQDNGGRMYTHALATIALCEALGMTADPSLKAPCQHAVDFLIKAQARDGGWRYDVAPRQGDMSVSSWCLMGLKSGQMAGLNVPRDTLDRATNFLKKMSRDDGGYNYMTGQPGHSPPTPAVMTAAGIVCRQYLQGSSGQAAGSEDIRSPNMTRGVDVILAHPPKANVHNFYYYYYATYALLPVGGEAWQNWNPQVRDLLVSWQDKGDKNQALRGSWDPQGAYQLQAAGRVGVTSLALLTLEVYYRHLPLNRPELGEMAKDLDTNKKK